MPPPYRITIEFQPLAVPRRDSRDQSFRFPKLACDCGRPKEPGFAGCPRCERLGRLMHDNGPTVVGVREPGRADTYDDVRVACTRWLKARGLEPEDPSWFTRAVEHFKGRVKALKPNPHPSKS